MGGDHELVHRGGMSLLVGGEEPHARCGDEEATQNGPSVGQHRPIEAPLGVAVVRT
jgi:hypothetical protein